jgi:superfamily II DNA or RNA helicase/HKD family nuclease
MLGHLQDAARHCGVAWSEVEQTLNHSSLKQANKAGSGPNLLTPHSTIDLLKVIKRELQQADTVWLASAFCSRGMLNLLMNPLEEFAARGGNLQLLTSVMGNFNNPDDLLHIQDTIPGLELKVFYPPVDGGACDFSKEPPPFHVKCYLFEKDPGQQSLIIGSSNLTKAGLSLNHEWNYYSNCEIALPINGQRSAFSQAKKEFNHYWSHQAVPLSDDLLAVYRPRWENARRRSQRQEQSGQELARLQSPEPRPAQRDALANLKTKRQLGVRRTAVIAATGLGKTYLAAFDFRQSACTNVLFLVHRETILGEARKAFRNVMEQPEFGVVLSSNASTAERDLAHQSGSSVFAMVQTLSREETLREFDRRHFEYIVIDEFHHSEASTYQRILEYFESKFMLGLTATPERLDGRDVLRFCDYDIAYEARLFDAIENHWLSPFQYFAIHDATDYSEIRWTGRGYDEQQLEEHLNQDTRARLITHNLRKFLPAIGKIKALAFCSSKGHARYMTKQFNLQGFSATCLLGENSEVERQTAIRELQDESHHLQVICSVDIFSEGVDIPAVSHILLLRPTQSFTVFQQQLGRGLRKSPGKDFLVVLDFIGNFRNSYVAPIALRGYATLDSYKQNKKPAAFRLPAECSIDLATEVERIWEKEIKRVLCPRTVRERLCETYNTMRLDLGHSPDILDFFANPDACDPHQFVKCFGNWLRTKEAMSDLSSYETSLLGTQGEAFLQHIEKELNSVKSYKMVVLLNLLGTMPKKTSWPVAEIATLFLDHYLNHPAQLADFAELAKSANPAGFAIAKVERLLLSMPLKFLSNKAESFFVLDRGTGRFSIKETVHPFWQSPPFRQLLLDRTLYALKRYFYRRQVDLTQYNFDPQQLSTHETADSPQSPLLPETGTAGFAEPACFEPPPPIMLPYFPNLKLACGAFREGDVAEAETIGVCDPHGSLEPGRHFVVQAVGDSMTVQAPFLMEEPRGELNASPWSRVPIGSTIEDGELILLERLDAEHAGSLTAERAVAVEYRDEAGSLAYALKRVVKDGAGRYRLVSRNPDYPALEVDPESMFPMARALGKLKTGMDT